MLSRAVSSQAAAYSDGHGNASYVGVWRTSAALAADVSRAAPPSEAKEDRQFDDGVQHPANKHAQNRQQAIRAPQKQTAASPGPGPNATGRESGEATVVDSPGSPARLRRLSQDKVDWCTGALATLNPTLRPSAESSRLRVNKQKRERLSVSVALESQPPPPPFYLRCHHLPASPMPEKGAAVGRYHSQGPLLPVADPSWRLIDPSEQTRRIQDSSSARWGVETVSGYTAASRQGFVLQYVDCSSLQLKLGPYYNSIYNLERMCRFRLFWECVILKAMPRELVGIQATSSNPPSLSCS
nr:hypothetical protein Iba_chr05cCG0910 [Ipomoea batatas]